MMVPVVIVGAGPAGTEAAIQLRRNRIDFRLLEKEKVGGLLNEANRVENFPGIPSGVPGRVLAARLRRQLEALDITVEKSRMLSMDCRNGLFELHTERETVAAARVILACGTQPLPPVPPLDQETLRGNVFSSVLPLIKTRGGTVAIIGGGDAAFDYALSLAMHNEVHILVRASRPRALPLLVERCRRLPRIFIHENCRLVDALPAERGEIVLKTADAPGGRGNEIRCGHVLSAIGRVPALDFLDADLLAAMAEMQMGKKLFLAGDAGNGPWRYAAIAAADGQRAAMEIMA